MHTTRPVKLPNCSPFPISVDRLIELYAKIKANGYLQLECLTKTDTTKEFTTEHTVPAPINSTPPESVSKRQPIRNNEDVRIKNITKPLLTDNILKRSRDLYDFPENDQEDTKQVKIARIANSVQRSAGNFENVLASLKSDQNTDMEVHNSPNNKNNSTNNKLATQQDSKANNVRMDFEYEATSPTRITVNIQDTVNHIKDI